MTAQLERLELAPDTLPGLSPDPPLHDQLQHGMSQSLLDARSGRANLLVLVIDRSQGSQGRERRLHSGR